MKPAAFEYHRAETLEHAVQLLESLGEGAKPIAGGQSLAAMMNLRLARPEALVDLNHLPGLAYIRAAQELRIGALTRHRQLEHYPAVLDGFPLIQEAGSFVGHYPIRTRGTFGGSIAHADPAAEWCLLAVLHDAEVVLQGPEGRRVSHIDDFLQGFFMTDLREAEVVVEVALRRRFQRGAIQEFARRRGDFAVVAAMVGANIEGGVCTEVRIVLGGVGATPVRVPDAEELLTAAVPTPGLLDEVGEVVARRIDPPSDIHGDATYRKELASVLVRRALTQALG